MIIRSLDEAEAFTTADGSTIRELLGLPTAPVQNQSLAEATLEPGQETQRHYHAEAEEIYYVVEGSGEMELDGDTRTVGVGDAVLIPPGAWHQIRAGDGRLRFLCCCAPAYRHDDTYSTRRACCGVALTAAGRFRWMAKVTIGLQVIPQHGDYDAMKRAWVEADELGVDRIYNWDHFYPLSGDPNGKHFESLTIQAAMAEATSKAEISSLVICNSYRNPNLLADMSRTIDHISGGRFILGIGSGWFEKDYDEYGYEFGTAASRLRDLDRDLPIIKARWAKLNPPPLRRIPILIGGGGEKVTLRIVAEHADIWHSFGDAETMRHKSAILDDWCAKVGRDPAEIQRSTTINRMTGETRDAQEYLDLGFTDFVVSIQGPEWDMEPLRRALAWRDSL